jgi:hypothetical protein
MHVALAIADPFDRRIIRLPAVPQQGQKLTIVISNRIERLPRKVRDRDNPSAIVVSL